MTDSETKDSFADILAKTYQAFTRDMSIPDAANLLTQVQAHLIKIVTKTPEQPAPVAIKTDRKRLTDTELRLRESIVLESFFQQCIVKDPTGVIYYRDLSKLWNDWCDKLSFPTYHIRFYKTKTRYGKFLEEKLAYRAVSTSDKQLVFWTGYRLLQEGTTTQ